MITTRKFAMPSRTVATVFLLGAFALTGCGGATSDQVFDARRLQGTVDTALPPETQAKQEALRRLLNGLQDGIGEKGALNLFVPGVDYLENFDAFYDGHKRLVRWEFNGQPTRDDIPVLLCFDDVESGPIDPAKEKRVERVYVVSRSGQRYAIARR